MKLGKRAIALWCWVLLTVVAGVGLVVLDLGTILSMIGVVAIIIGLISLMPALMYTLEEENGAAA